MASQSNVVTWSTAISKNHQNGRAIIFRFADKLDPEFQRSSQPDRVILVWNYTSDSGQPDRAASEQMDLLEDLLGPSVYKDQFATLALVSTGENLREWIFYARSEDEFIDRLNIALDGHLFPIEIYTASDPSWENYQMFHDGVKRA